MTTTTENRTRVRREQVLDYQTYREGREAHRQRAMALKAQRRIHVGEHLTFLFENSETIRYQIQEMLLAEQIVKEAEIRHEIDTYNDLLGGPGELGATLLIEIESPAERDQRLREWLELPKAIYAKLEDGSLVRPRFDPRQISEGRLSSVHYLKFALAGRTPLAVGCDLPALQVETTLAAEQRAALAEDLRAGAYS
ncbi:MAG: DUF3501 family protein [Vicinamibacteria bacterium]